MTIPIEVIRCCKYLMAYKETIVFLLLVLVVLNKTKICPLDVRSILSWMFFLLKVKQESMKKAYVEFLKKNFVEICASFTSKMWPSLSIALGTIQLEMCQKTSSHNPAAYFQQIQLGRFHFLCSTGDHFLCQFVIVSLPYYFDSQFERCHKLSF